MKRHYGTLIAVVAALCLGGSAMAQEGGEPAKQSKKSRKEQFKKCDTSRDRQISLAEAESCGMFAGEDGAAQFARIDLDGDGQITQKEVKATHSRSGTDKDEMHQESQASAKTKFQQMDTNGDGFLTLGECQAAGQFTGQEGIDRFEKMDADRDGMLSQEEAGKRMSHKAKKDRMADDD